MEAKRENKQGKQKPEVLRGKKHFSIHPAKFPCRY